MVGKAFLFHSSVVKSCILATPVRLNRSGAACAGPIAQVHSGVPPVHRKQHKTQIKSKASTAQHLSLQSASQTNTQCVSD